MARLVYVTRGLQVQQRLHMVTLCRNRRMRIVPAAVFVIVSSPSYTFPTIVSYKHPASHPHHRHRG
jgi:hypothetical protein